MDRFIAFILLGALVPSLVECHEDTFILEDRMDNLETEIVDVRDDASRIERRILNKVEVMKVSLRNELKQHIKHILKEVVSEVVQDESVEEMLRSKVIAEVKQLKRDNHQMKRQLHHVMRSLRGAQHERQTYKEAFNKADKAVTEIRLCTNHDARTKILLDKCNSNILQKDKEIMELQQDVRKLNVSLRTYTSKESTVSPAESSAIDTSTTPSIAAASSTTKMPKGERGIGCPDMWVGYGNSCYLFIGTKVPWVQASHVCANKGAALAAIETAEERLFIWGYLKGFDGVGADMTAYIGGNDMDVEGIWRWSPSGERINFTDWYPGQPDPHGDCLIIWKGHNYHWGDIPCTYQGNFICEKSKGRTDPVIG